MCRLFETIRIEDGRPMNLVWHEERMLRSGLMRDAGCGMEDAGYVSRNWLKELISVPENMNEGIVKCNIIYDKEIIEIKFGQYVRRPVRSLKLIHARGLDYHLKYFDRSVLDTLFAERGDCDDVIIVNDGLITDTSFSNLIFFNGESWYTPARPLLEGTCRARLLSEKRIIAVDIRPSDLTRYQGCKLINAMRMPEEEEIIRNEGMKD